MKKQKRHHNQVAQQLPKHVSKNKKAVQVDGEQVFWPGYGFGGYGYRGFGFGAPIGVGIGAGIGVGVGLGLGLGGFGYYGGWL